MRRVRYRVACSLDGYICGPGGELDWIMPDPDSGLSQLYREIDTVLLGRLTYQLTLQPGAPPWPADWRVFVFSTTLDVEDRPRVTVASSAAATVRALRAEDGGDIWLFGGGALSRSLLEAGLVDTVEVALMPVLLGGGVRLLESGAAKTRLRVAESRISPNGIVNLQFEVEPSG